MSGEKRELTEILLDFSIALESAAVNLKRYISDLLNEPANPIWDPSRIHWERVEGGKGPYEKATAEGNKGNSDFDGLVADLKAHGGRLRRLGFFYWLFELSESPAVGRKLVKRV